MKIVIIGAGSRDFGRGQVADIMQSHDMMNRDVSLTLVDERPGALETMLGFAAAVARHSGSDVTVDGTTDRCAALPGADFAITAVARRRWELWEQDFRLPLARGFRHCLGENGGPGGLFHTLRSLHIVLPIYRDIERLAPGALALNFTNPEARVLHAVCHLTAVRTVGICHGIFEALALISRALGRPVDELEVVSAGMNHLYHVMSIRDRATGEELRPLVRQRVLSDPSLKAPPLFRKMLEVFDLFSYPSDDHIGEYLSYGAEYGGVRWKYGRESRPVPPVDPPAVPDLLAAAARPGGTLDPILLEPSGESTVPIIESRLTGRSRRLPAVNVLNDGGLVENLPPDVVVEVPGRADGGGVHPVPVGRLPDTIAALMLPHYQIHRLCTEAYRTGERRLLLQALLLDPNVNSIREAEGLLDEMLRLQRDFLPEFH